MTYQEWRDNPALAEDLAKLLANPVMKIALQVVDGMSAAKVLGSSHKLLEQSSNAHVLFGFDSGRASIINDLEALSVVPAEIQEVSQNYGTEF